ncbi:MAG: hypothetical protein ACOYNO_03100 [Saprospiraceae bacterium]
MAQLSHNTHAWLQKHNCDHFANDFLLGSNGTADQRKRYLSVTLAVRWCMAAECAQDGDRVPSPYMRQAIREVLYPWFSGIFISSETIDAVWVQMCQHSAEYRFAVMDESPFNRANYGIYKHLLGPDQAVQPQEDIISNAIIKGFKFYYDEEEAKGYSYAISTHGLSSFLQIVPPDKSWIEVGDQLIMVVSPEK